MQLEETKTKEDDQNKDKDKGLSISGISNLEVYQNNLFL